MTFSIRKRDGLGQYFQSWLISQTNETFSIRKGDPTTLATVLPLDQTPDLRILQWAHLTVVKEPHVHCQRQAHPTDRAATPLQLTACSRLLQPSLHVYPSPQHGNLEDARQQTAHEGATACYTHILATSPTNHPHHNTRGGEATCYPPKVSLAQHSHLPSKTFIPHSRT